MPVGAGTFSAASVRCGVGAGTRSGIGGAIDSGPRASGVGSPLGGAAEGSSAGPACIGGAGIFVGGRSVVGGTAEGCSADSAGPAGGAKIPRERSARPGRRGVGGVASVCRGAARCVAGRPGAAAAGAAAGGDWVEGAVGGARPRLGPSASLGRVAEGSGAEPSAVEASALSAGRPSRPLPVVCNPGDSTSSSVSSSGSASSHGGLASGSAVASARRLSSARCVAPAGSVGRVSVGSGSVDIVSARRFSKSSGEYQLSGGTSQGRSSCATRRPGRGLVGSIATRGSAWAALLAVAAAGPGGAVGSSSSSSAWGQAAAIIARNSGVTAGGSPIASGGATGLAATVGGPGALACETAGGRGWDQSLRASCVERAPSSRPAATSSATSGVGTGFVLGDAKRASLPTGGEPGPRGPQLVQC